MANDVVGTEYIYSESAQDWIPAANQYLDIAGSDDSSIPEAQPGTFKISKASQATGNIQSDDFLPPNLTAEEAAEYEIAIKSAQVRETASTSSKIASESLKSVNSLVDQFFSDDGFKAYLASDDEAYERVDVSPTLVRAIQHMYGPDATTETVQSAAHYFKLSPQKLAAIETALTGQEVKPKPTREQVASQRQRDIEAEIARRSEQDLYGLNSDEENEELEKLVQENQQRKRDNFYIAEAESFAGKYGLSSQELDTLVATTVKSINTLPNAAAKEKYSSPYGFGQALLAVYRSTGGKAKPNEKQAVNDKPSTINQLISSGKKIPVSVVQRSGKSFNYDSFRKLEEAGLIDYSR